MAERELIFRVHAIRRMFERRITVEDVRAILTQGRTIEDYPNDQPYPSRLILGFIGNRPLHVVVADVPQTNQTTIITVYEPDPSRWDSTFRLRKQP